MTQKLIKTKSYGAPLAVHLIHHFPEAVLQLISHLQRLTIAVIFWRELAVKNIRSQKSITIMDRWVYSIF